MPKKPKNQPAEGQPAAPENVASNLVMFGPVEAALVAAMTDEEVLDLFAPFAEEIDKARQDAGVGPSDVLEVGEQTALVVAHRRKIAAAAVDAGASVLVPPAQPVSDPVKPVADDPANEAPPQPVDVSAIEKAYTEATRAELPPTAGSPRPASTNGELEHICGVMNGVLDGLDPPTRNRTKRFTVDELKQFELEHAALQNFFASANDAVAGVIAWRAERAAGSTAPLLPPAGAGYSHKGAPVTAPVRTNASGYSTK